MSVFFLWKIDPDHSRCIFFHPEILEEEIQTKGRYILKVQKEYASLARKIITVSEFSKRDIHKYLDVPLNKIHVIPNATQWNDDSAVSPDKTFYEKYSIEPGKYFLSVGALRRNKNYQTLLDGFEKYRKDSRYGKEKLVIVGPNENSKIHAAMQNIPDVILLNNLSSQTLKMLYQNAKGFFLLSLIEGFGIPLLEAMQQGCPACYARGNAMDEIGRDAAFSIENPKDSDAVAEMFARFSFGGPEVQKSVSDCKRIASEYTWRNAACKTLELYKSIM